MSNDASPAQLMYDYCRSGSVTEATALLRLPNFNPNDKAGPLGEPFLTTAVRNSQIEIVNLLVEDSRIDVNAVNKNHETPLRVAAAEGNEKIVAALLKAKKVDVNKGDGKGITPLHIACSNGRQKVVELLLADSRINPNKPSHAGIPPIHVASEKGHSDIVTLILSDPRADVTIQHESSFVKKLSGKVHTAKEKGARISFSSIVKYVSGTPEMEESVNYTQRHLDQNSSEILKAIVRFRDLLENPDSRFTAIRANLVSQFLKSLGGVSDDVFTTCTWTLFSLSKIEVIRKEIIKNGGYQILVKSALDRYSQGNSTQFTIALRRTLSVSKDIQESISKKIPEIFKTLQNLLEKSPDPSLAVDYAGIILLLSGQHSHDKQLLENAKNILIHAAQEEHLHEKAFECLIFASASEISRPVLRELKIIESLKSYLTFPESPTGLNSRLIRSFLETIENSNSLCLACQSGNKDVVLMLLSDPSIDVNQPDSSGATAFLLSCKLGRLDLVNILISDPRVEVNKCDQNGTSPFLAACRAGKEEVIELLLADERIDISKSDGFGDTPLLEVWKNRIMSSLSLLLTDKRIEAINEGSENKKNPLAAACLEGPEKVKSLLQNSENLYEVIRDSKIFTDYSSFLRRNLSEDSPKFVDAFHMIDNLLRDPKSQSLVINSGLLEQLVACSSRLIEPANVSDTFLFPYFREWTRIEPVENELLRLNFFPRILQSFLNKSLPKQEVLLRQHLPSLFRKGRDIRESVAKGVPDFLDNLVKIIQTSEDLEVKLSATGFILMLSGNYTNSQAAVNATKELLFEAIKGDHGDQNQTFCLESLLTAAAIDTSRPIIISLGIRDLLHLNISDPKSPLGFLSCLVLALLSASDDPLHATSTEKTAPVVISQIVQIFQFWVRSYHSGLVSIVPGCRVDCKTTLLALRILSSNEENLQELLTSNLISSVILFFQNWGPSLDSENLEEVANLLWVLSFDQTSREELIAGKAISILKCLNTNNNPSTKRAVAGALWNLEEKEKQLKIATSQSQQAPKGHVMISYSWGQKTRMRQLAYYIKSTGIPIWLDIEQMEGSVLERMSEAVEEASAIVIGLSSTYKESQACRTEAEYAYRLKKEVVFVLAEDGYVAKGWLGAMVGNNLWYNPWAQEGGFEKGAKDIVEKIRRHISAENLIPAQDPAPAPAPAPVPVPELSPAPLPVPDLSPAPSTQFSNTGPSIEIPAIPIASLVVTPPMSPIVTLAPTLVLPQSSVATDRRRSMSQSQLLEVHKVQIPEKLEVLDPQDLTFEKIQNWKTEEVCRWLKMRNLENLIPYFIQHQVDGAALVHWDSLSAPERLGFWNSMGMNEVGLNLSFFHHLKTLIYDARTLPAEWGKDQVVAWLQKVQLPSLSELAKEQEWDGSILFILSKITQESSFAQLCSELGITQKVQQLKFHHRLRALFSHD